MLTDHVQHWRRRLEALGVLPQSPTAWDTSFVLDDHGFVGGFLSGLVGYRAKPRTSKPGAICSI